MRHVVVIIHRIGPYHRARLDAAAARMRITAIELSATSDTYAWDAVPDSPLWNRRTLSGAGGSDEIERALTELQPDVVAFPAWSRTESLFAFAWCVGRGAPAIVLWESQRIDSPRTAAGEIVKRGILRHASAAFAGGRTHAEYLRELGFPPDRIHLGYDVVDNAHFARGAAAARTNAAATRAQFGLPAHYFLCNCRFVAKKNVQTLIAAFAQFTASSNDANGIDLVLCGDGPLRGELEQKATKLGVASRVHFLGFRQYEELPAIYGLADAFFLLSTSEPWGLVVNEAMACGLPVCVSSAAGAGELVPDGVCDITRDAVADSAAAMTRFAASAENHRAAGERNAAAITDWSPARFADGLAAAAETATSLPRKSSRVGAAWLRAMAHAKAARS